MLNGRRRANPQSLEVLKHKFDRRVARAIEALDKGVARIDPEIAPFVLDAIVEKQSKEKALK